MDGATPRLLRCGTSTLQNLGWLCFLLFPSEWFGLSAYAVAKAVGTTPIVISQICRRKRSVSAEMALKLGRLFRVSPELWMGIQADYDLEVTRLRVQSAIEKRVRPLSEPQAAAA